MASLIFRLLRLIFHFGSRNGGAELPAPGIYSHSADFPLVLLPQVECGKQDRNIHGRVYTGGEWLKESI
jgi:hypothetical protein